MANRRPQHQHQQSGRRMDFGRNDRNKSFGRGNVSPWQGAGPGGSGLPNLLPLASGSTEATLALASNLINLLQPRQSPVPSLLDMPIRRDFSPHMGRFDRNFGPNRMGNQGNFRRTGNYNRAGERINTNRKPFRPNDGYKQHNKNSQKKETDSKAKPAKESESTEPTNEDAEKQIEEGKEGEPKKDGNVKAEKPKTRYDEINSQLLKCHICNKSMWDGRSFENHLSGRAHAIMMQKTAESYALTADTMRQEFKIREMKRTRKSGQQPTRDFYCAMCDMYAADGAVHRTNVGHRKLKKYLHPTCTSCHMEMPNRIELDEHRLTPEHLKNLQDKQGSVSKPKPEAVMVISTLSMEQSYLREDRHRWRHGDHEDRDRRHGRNADKNHPEIKQEKEEIEETNGEEEKNDEEEKNGDVEKNGEEKSAEGEEGKEEVEVKKEPESLDNINTILDYTEGDDLSEITREMYPAYSIERGVGQSFLGEFRCVQCRLCRKLLDNEETAAVHLKTWRHHQLFLRMLADKKQEQQPQEPQPEATQEATKRSAAEEEDGNWKRRKTTDNGQDDDNIQDEPNCEEDLNEGNHVDAEMPPADELDDWQNDDGNEDASKDEDQLLESEPEPPVVVKREPSPVPAPAPAPVPVSPAAPATPATPSTPSTRARGRGRGRGRGRY